MFATFNKKAAALTLAALTLGAGVTMNAGEAEARFGRKGLIAAGVVGALVTGAIAASAANRHHGGYYSDPSYDYAPAPVYTAPRPVYAEPQPVYYGEPEVQYYGRPGYGYAPHPQPRRHNWRNRHAGYSETGYAYRGPNCKLKKQQVWNGYGYELQHVQVCR